ncbi:Hairy/enhancer-of-split with YRPW motif protein 2, partial [Dimargaris verticillata]
MSPAVTPNNPPRPPLIGTEVETFAYITIKDRLPAILTQVVDHIYRTYTALADTTSASAVKVAEAKQIVQALGQLRYEMQTDKPITPLAADAHSDYTVWNEVIATHFAGKTWFTATWLFSECYMYRRIYQAFAVTEHWKDYDYFAEKKHSAFLAA